MGVTRIIKWHADMGATADQLKSAPEFKYTNRWVTNKTRGKEAGRLTSHRFNAREAPSARALLEASGPGWSSFPVGSAA